MATITIKTGRSKAVEYWMKKERGSWEDNNRDTSHPYSLLQRFGGNLSLTQEQAKSLLRSAEYHADGWDNDDIEGGERTLTAISNYAKKLRLAIELATN